MISIIQYAVSSKISRQALYRLCERGVISDPLTADSQFILKRLEKIWGDPDLIRAQLARYSLPRRQRIAAGANLTEKWERYALGRYLGKPPGTRLPIRTVCREIEKHFCFTPSEDRIRQIRDRARKWLKLTLSER